ncbi:monooxygenase [Trichosporon asahii var. asahii CBS 8904]|uniref:Monooxygenase n=1 Tax=Trichosporon asahii var. asahii (strain CBS 8904) TaxID=1220162 RepID=K1WAM3_TRIAC|nr:monooxygenase [Trichosporon asahii var. asahii CBS 8904]
MSDSPAIPLPPLTRVAVIGGGGPSGLVAVKQLLDAGVRPDQIAAFDARPAAGGVWNYVADPGTPDIAWRENGMAVLRSEREKAHPGALGPGDSMAYRGAEFPESNPLFPHHPQVKEYLQAYSREKGVIQWNTLVTSVKHNPSSTGPADHWAVEVEHDGKRRTEYVSHVIVSNGHYNEPFVPSVPGLDTFKGTLIHSRWWRNAAQFRGKNVIVVGSRASGFDIARELAQDDYNAREAGHPNPERKIYQSVRGVVDKPEWDTDFPLVWRDHGCLADRQVRRGHVRAHGREEDLGRGRSHPVTKSLAPAEEGIPAAGGQTIMNLTPDDVFYAPDPTLAFIGLREYHIPQSSEEYDELTADYMVNPLLLGETTAHLIAWAFTHNEVPPLPPLIRMTDSPHDIKVGFPAEFDNQDNWLKAIGEEANSQGGDHPDHGWPRISDRTRQLREDALKLRREHLGY